MLFDIDCDVDKSCDTDWLADCDTDALRFSLISRASSSDIDALMLSDTELLRLVYADNDWLTLIELFIKTWFATDAD